MKTILYFGLTLLSLSFITEFADQATTKAITAMVQEEEVPQPEFTKVGEPYKVTATMYNAVPGQCDSDPLTTAGMYKINPDSASEHRWIAMSRDMLERWGGEFQYGDYVMIEGADHKNGIYKVTDTMNKRYKNRIDILETKGTPMYKFDNVTLTKVVPTDETLLASL